MNDDEKPATIGYAPNLSQGVEVAGLTIEVDVYGQTMLRLIEAARAAGMDAEPVFGFHHSPGEKATLIIIGIDLGVHGTNADNKPVDFVSRLTETAGTSATASWA